MVSTAVEVRGYVTLGNEPKTRRSKRTVPVARSMMRELERHLAEFVEPAADALVFTAPEGGPLRRSLFARRAWEPAVKSAGLPPITFHGLRHSFVAHLGGGRLQCPGGLGVGGAQQCGIYIDPVRRPVRGRLDEAVDRLDALLGNVGQPGGLVLPLARRKS